MSESALDGSARTAASLAAGVLPKVHEVTDVLMRTIYQQNLGYRDLDAVPPDDVRDQRHHHLGDNLDSVRSMPGITDVAAISHGVAVRGDTFGQCIDAIQALEVTWGSGTVDGESDDTVAAKLRAAQLPMAVPPLLSQAVDAEFTFTFAFASNSPLEPDNAIADVRPGSAEIWASLKVPIVAQEQIAAQLGLPVSAVKLHVVQGGDRSAGTCSTTSRPRRRRSRRDRAEIGKPMKMSWSRTDNFRQGRTHPMCICRVRAN